jgi:hypothetical protein
MDADTAPPRRYSVGQADYDYEVGKRLSILLDGVEQKAVVEYDCDAGTILRNKLDADGRPQVDPNNRERVWRETVRGKVTVEWNDG